MFEFLLGDIFGNFEVFYYVNILIIFYIYCVKTSMCSTYVNRKMKKFLSDFHSFFNTYNLMESFEDSEIETALTWWWSAVEDLTICSV